MKYAIIKTWTTYDYEGLGGYSGMETHTTFSEFDNPFQFANAVADLGNYDKKEIKLIEFNEL